MNGYDIYEKAVLRLGYKNTEESSVVDIRFTERTKEFINQILSDLKKEEIMDLNDEIALTPDFAEALCCGVAKLLSLSEGDTNKNVIFTALYNAKRTSVLSRKSNIEDLLPTMED